MALTTEQLAQRKQILTASDVAAVCGLSPWRTPYDVYADKVGDSAPWGGNWKTRRGETIEPLLIAWLAEQKAPLTVRPAGATTLVHRHIPWLGATPDALVYDGGTCVAVGEAKSSGSVEDWTDEGGDPQVPDYYYVQVLVQMAVCAVPRAFVVAEILGGYHGEPEIIEVERDEETLGAVLAECERFWIDHVVARKPPAPDGSPAAQRMLSALYPRHTRDMIDATPELEKLGQEYLAAAAAEAEATAEKKRLQAALCSAIGAHEGVRGDGWRALWTEREATEIAAYTRKAYRAFDLRAVGQGRKRKVA